jgi:tetratricopeptide (TPR) repeat protein
VLATVTYYLYQTDRFRDAYREWSDTRSLNYADEHYDFLAEAFERAYPVLRYNGLFLQQYAKVLAMRHEYDKAMAMLLVARRYYCDDGWYVAMGDCEEATGAYSSALQSYTTGGLVEPSRFYPLYRSIQVCQRMGDHAMAMQLAQALLKKDIKIDSKDVQKMRSEMRLLLSEAPGKQRNQ